jgi:hypothetical protein
MRDRRIRRAFIALILTLPALILLATAVTTASVMEWLVVEAVVAGGLVFALWAKAHLQRSPVVTPVRIPVATVRHRSERNVRSVA